MLKLQFKNNQHNAVWLVGPRLTIGQDSSSDMVIQSPKAESKHLEIAVVGEKLELVKIADDSNVLINGRRFNERTPISVGDVIKVAGIELLIADPKTRPSDKQPAKATSNIQAPSGWVLKPNHSALSGKMFPINGRLIVGRSSECDLVFTASHLSRRHAELYLQNGQLFVRDLGSSNGTYVNDKEVKESALRRGDELRFDTLPFGVIGPSDDMDRTVVRTGTRLKPVSDDENSSKSKSPKSKASKKHHDSQTKITAKNQQKNTMLHEEEKKGASLLPLFILMALGGGAYYAYIQGYLDTFIQ